MNLIEEANLLFGNEVRPEHFTDYKHCAECAEHDETLRRADNASLTFNDVRPGWDPLCFITPEGFRYYFPALVRLAIEGTGPRYFIDKLIFHLELDGNDNCRYLVFSSAQREFVVRVLNYLLEVRAAEIEENLDTERLFRAITIWDN